MTPAEAKRELEKTVNRVMEHVDALTKAYTAREKELGGSSKRWRRDPYWVSLSASAHELSLLAEVVAVLGNLVVAHQTVPAAPAAPEGCVTAFLAPETVERLTTARLTWPDREGQYVTLTASEIGPGQLTFDALLVTEGTDEPAPEGPGDDPRCSGTALIYCPFHPCCDCGHWLPRGHLTNTCPCCLKDREATA